MRIRSLTLATILLVACTPATPPADDGERVMEGTGIMIRVEKETTEDEQAVLHTKAILHVTGVAEQDIDLGDIQGELLYVDPATYPVYSEEENMPETVAIFTAWFAGQGEEIRVLLHNQELIVDHRYGDEQNTCTEYEEIARVALGRDVVVEWENLGETTPQSSIAFCNK